MPLWEVCAEDVCVEKTLKQGTSRIFSNLTPALILRMSFVSK